MLKPLCKLLISQMQPSRQHSDVLHFWNTISGTWGHAEDVAAQSYHGAPAPGGTQGYVTKSRCASINSEIKQTGNKILKKNYEKMSFWQKKVSIWVFFF